MRADIRNAESTVVTLRADDLAVTPGQIARCAGGSRYRLHLQLRALVDAVLERAAQLVDPAFVYSIHEVAAFLTGGYVKLSNGLTFPIPAREQDTGTKYLALCVCTIGRRLAEAVRPLISTGAVADGLFLDSAGVAFLELLSARAYEILQRQAQERQLQFGCRFGPGYNGLDLSYQKQLFKLVDASAIGVRLNETCVMSPAKSLSFSMRWTTSQVSKRSRRKCATCTLTRCPFRV